MRRSGDCCSEYDITTGPHAVKFEEIEDILKAQWCGCGARPGVGLRPLVSTSKWGRPAPQPGVIPGYGYGNHGLEIGVLENVPNVNVNYPLPYRLPETRLEWGNTLPPVTEYSGCTDSYAPWLYSVGPKV